MKTEKTLVANWVRLQYLTVRTADGFEVGSVSKSESGWKARFEGEYSPVTAYRLDAMSWLAEQLDDRGVPPNFLYEV